MGIEANAFFADEAAKKLAARTLDTFNSHIQTIRAKLDLGFISPEVAKESFSEVDAALKEQAQGLLDTMEAHPEAGTLYNQVFLGVADSAKKVGREIVNADRIIQRAAKEAKRTVRSVRPKKPNFGVTEELRNSLAGLKGEAELGLRPLVEVYNDLEEKIAAVFARIKKVQQGGVSKMSCLYLQVCSSNTKRLRVLLILLKENFLMLINLKKSLLKNL